MTERTRLINYLLYGLFSAIKCNENTGKNFPRPLASATAFFVAHTKEVSVCKFFFQLLKIKLYFVCTSFLLSSPTARSFTHNSKEPSSRKKSHNARSLQENNACSAANQRARTIVPYYMKFWRHFHSAILAIFQKIAKLKCTKIKCR